MSNIAEIDTTDVPIDVKVVDDIPKPPKPVANNKKYKRRKVLLQHNHGKPMVIGKKPKLTKAELRKKRHKEITERRLARQQMQPVGEMTVNGLGIPVSSWNVKPAV